MSNIYNRNRKWLGRVKDKVDAISEKEVLKKKKEIQHGRKKDKESIGAMSAH